MIDRSLVAALEEALECGDWDRPVSPAMQAIADRLRIDPLHLGPVPTVLKEDHARQGRTRHP